jgi:pimeloyl-ACP methyl ester carboxylesterase
VLSLALYSLVVLLLLAVAAPVVLVAYLIVRYTPIIGRVFEEKPMFLPPRLAPRDDGEEVRFTTSDGLELAGSYLRSRRKSRAGVLVFCHEFLSDRWSYEPYADALRDLGFDIFTFDFRNHGASPSDPVYQPLQWVTDHEVRDLEAALAYLRSRSDNDPAGFVLSGISRGGGTALLVAARQPDVWGVITDGAFPTSGTMIIYILRWAEIFIKSKVLYAILRDYAPTNVFRLLGWVGQRRAERRLSCRFPSIEKAVAQLSPRPWLMIHGAKDAYIVPEIAERLWARAGEPKELWIVPGAKHNRCREVDAAGYAGRIESFLGRYAPRGLPASDVESDSGSPASPHPTVESNRSSETKVSPPVRLPLTAPVGSLSGA